MPLNFTSRDEMQSIFSVMGIDTRLADDSPEGEVNNPTEETYLVDCQHYATDEISNILGKRYEPAALSTNRWVRRTASYIACYHLSARRGNPKQFVSYYKKALVDLQRIADGQIPLRDEEGDIVPASANHNPSHSNLVVDDWYSRKKLRVQTETSSGGRYPSQDTDNYPRRGLE